MSSHPSLCGGPDHSSGTNMTKRIARVATLLAMIGWSMIAPQPVLAQLLPPLPIVGASLVVNITEPTSGATVSGTTVPVTASVSVVGSLIVGGVQFKLDGNNLGAEVTTRPYTISWNTTTATNGSHTLTAVARALGSLATWTSDPVTVRVANPPTVTINQAAGQADPTSASPINFT